MNLTSSGKDPVQLLSEADGEPRWLKEALEQIWARLPEPTPPPPKKELPSWNPELLALLHLDSGSTPLTTKNRWYLAEWLKQLAAALTDGTLDEGDSKEGFVTMFALGHTKASSGPREKRGAV